MRVDPVGDGFRGGHGFLANQTKSTETTLLNETEITLGLLHAVHENSLHTQRSLARELGVALGLANAYLKRCVKKGLIKVTQVPANRYAYYLTPKGFVEKSRLTGEYLSQSLKFFREARGQCAELFDQCAQRQWNRIAFAGAGDLCEIALLCVRDYPLTIAGIVDAAGGKSESSTFFGLPVTETLAGLEAVEAVVVTDMTDPQATFEAVARQIEGDRVLAPPFLKISRKRPEPVE